MSGPPWFEKVMSDYVRHFVDIASRRRECTDVINNLGQTVKNPFYVLDPSLQPTLARTRDAWEEAALAWLRLMGTVQQGREVPDWFVPERQRLQSSLANVMQLGNDRERIAAAVHTCQQAACSVRAMMNGEEYNRPPDPYPQGSRFWGLIPWAKEKIKKEIAGPVQGLGLGLGALVAILLLSRMGSR